MSVTANGQFITCDGQCGARVPVPVGLRTLLAAEAGSMPPAAGWLFVSSMGHQRHYCPKCSADYLRAQPDLDPQPDLSAGRLPSPRRPSGGG